MANSQLQSAIRNPQSAIRNPRIGNWELKIGYWLLGLAAFAILQTPSSILAQTRSAVMVTNATGVLAAPANFFAANSNLLNQAVNNNHGSGGGGGGYSPDGATIILNGSSQLEIAPTVTNALASLASLASLGQAATNAFVASAAGKGTNISLSTATNLNYFYGPHSQYLYFPANIAFTLTDSANLSAADIVAASGGTLTLGDQAGDTLTMRAGSLQFSGALTATSFSGPLGAANITGAFAGITNSGNLTNGGAFSSDTNGILSDGHGNLLVTNKFTAGSYANLPLATYANDGPPGIANFDGTTIALLGYDSNSLPYFGVNGANLTGLAASAIATGTISESRMLVSGAATASQVLVNDANGHLVSTNKLPAVDGSGVTNINGSGFAIATASAASQATNFTLMFGSAPYYTFAASTNVNFTDTSGGPGPVSWWITNSGAAGLIINIYFPTNSHPGYTNDCAIAGTNYVMSLTNTSSGRVLFLSAFKYGSSDTFNDVVWNHIVTLP